MTPGDLSLTRAPLNCVHYFWVVPQYVPRSSSTNHWVTDIQVAHLHDASTDHAYSFAVIFPHLHVSVDTS